MQKLLKANNLIAISVLIALSLCVTPLMAHAANYSSADKAALTTAVVQQSSSTYKVVFKANGGKGTMKAQNVTSGKKTTLAANKFTRAGYKFIGWNTKKNGKGKSYKNKAKVKNLAKAGKSVTLYAQWKKAVSYTIKTKDYSFTIPKYWRGKVTWKTTSSKYGNHARTYWTKIYLKGHKGDGNYELANVMSGRFTGLNSGYDVIFHKKTKLQDDWYPVSRTVTMWSKNVPYFIWAGYYESNKDLWIPLKDRKMMLDLATFGTVSYAKAMRNADFKTPAYKAVKKYQKKYFKPSFKVLR